MRVYPNVQAGLQAVKATTPDPIPESLFHTQNTKFQCLFIKRRKPDGDTCQFVIGPSLLLLLLVIVFLLRGVSPTQLLWAFYIHEFCATIIHVWPTRRTQKL